MLPDTAEAPLRGNFITLNACIRKEDIESIIRVSISRSQINKSQLNPSKYKKNNKNKCEINKIETKSRDYQQSQKLCFF